MKKPQENPLRRLIRSVCLVGVFLVTSCHGGFVGSGPSDSGKLYHASCEGDLNQVKKLIQSAHVNVVINSETPLHCAAKVSFENLLHHPAYREIVEILLSNGADVSLTDKKGNTALHNAGIGGDIGIATSIVCAGANRTAKNHEGQTPFEVFTSHRREGNYIDEVRDLLDAPEQTLLSTWCGY